MKPFASKHQKNLPWRPYYGNPVPQVKCPDHGKNRKPCSYQTPPVGIFQKSMSGVVHLKGLLAPFVSLPEISNPPLS